MASCYQPSTARRVLVFTRFIPFVVEVFVFLWLTAAHTIKFWKMDQLIGFGLFLCIVLDAAEAYALLRAPDVFRLPYWAIVPWDILCLVLLLSGQLKPIRWDSWKRFYEVSFERVSWPFTGAQYVIEMIALIHVFLATSYLLYYLGRQCTRGVRTVFRKIKRHSKKRAKEPDVELQARPKPTDPSTVKARPAPC